MSQMSGPLKATRRKIRLYFEPVPSQTGVVLPLPGSKQPVSGSTAKTKKMHKQWPRPVRVFCTCGRRRRRRAVVGGQMTPQRLRILHLNVFQTALAREQALRLQAKSDQCSGLQEALNRQQVLVKGAREELGGCVPPVSVKSTLLLQEPFPCNPAAETALQGLIWCFLKLIFPHVLLSRGVFFTDTGRRQHTVSAVSALLRRRRAKIHRRTPFWLTL